MLNTITPILEIIVQYYIMTLLSHYVFLNKALKGKYQFLYDVVSVAIVGLAYFINSLAAEILLMALVGLNIYLAASHHRIAKVFYVLPIEGFTMALCVPLVELPPTIMVFDEMYTNVYHIIVYSVMLLAFIIYTQFSKKFRIKFANTLEYRSLEAWEIILLFVIGILLVVAASYIQDPIEAIRAGGSYSEEVIQIITALGVITFVLSLAIIIVVSVGNKQHFYQAKLTDMQFNIIVMMAEIVENRDENTGGHIRRTAKYVEIIANELRKEEKYKDVLTTAYIKDIIVAAPLHDIGKIHVPDAILNKPDRLTDEEFEHMKMHAHDGKELLTHAKIHLGDFPYLDRAIEMAGYHHEWYDGKRGYPNEKIGEAIPLSARIMAVADVFDALISKRCYKAPMPLEKAYSIIRGESGTHFDPVVVDAFFNALDVVEASIKEFDAEETDGVIDVDLANFEKFKN